MAKLVIHQTAEIIEVAPSVLMIHKMQPPMVCIVDEVEADGQGFFGTCVETGIRQAYSMSQFEIFRGKLSLEQ